jgi:hypothetical protein
MPFSQHKSKSDETPIGLGYTLFSQDKQGRVIRVEPSHEFAAGDSVRIAIEPNTDGYLYIFHTENDGHPEMIFPDARLHQGDNAILAHVPYEVPSSLNPDANLRWFIFDEHAATEKLYVVVTLRPLADVPTKENLVSYCGAHKEACPWQPSASVWKKVQTNGEKPIVCYSKNAGQEQTATEAESANRGVGLPKDAPPPSVIYMSRTAGTDLLVTSISLIHK